MAIFDLFSKREKRNRGEVTDVFQYTKVTKKFKVQVIHIIYGIIGNDSYKDDVQEMHKYVHDTLCREYGVFSLSKYANSNFEEIQRYFLETQSYTDVLDIIELYFRIIDLVVRKKLWRFKKGEYPDDVIKELNERFKENSLGYQYESGQIIKVGDQLLHQETVKPALLFLNEIGFEGAREEFLKAFDNYKQGKYKECLAECLKTFESTFKIIFDQKNWEYKKGDNIKKLISIALEHELIPIYWQNHFSSLKTLLENSIPVARNKLGGHGDGSEIQEVPEYLASYQLHMTASTVVFLVKASK